MPPRPRQANTSSCGKCGAISSSEGGSDRGASAPVRTLSAVRLSFARHRTQRPSGASAAILVRSAHSGRSRRMRSWFTDHLLSVCPRRYHSHVGHGGQARETDHLLSVLSCCYGAARNSSRRSALPPHTRSSSSRSSGLETVCAICSRNSSRNRLRSRWTAARAAPALTPSAAATSP